jgi:hypothetical protein
VALLQFRPARRSASRSASTAALRRNTIPYSEVVPPELPSSQGCHGLVGIPEPQDGKQPDDDHLANNGEAVDEKRAKATSQRRFDQIQHVHKTALELTDMPLSRCASPSGRSVPSPRGPPFHPETHTVSPRILSYSHFRSMPSQKEPKKSQSTVLNGACAQAGREVGVDPTRDPRNPG